MADPGWGFASGFLSGTQEMQAIQLNNAKIADAPIQLARDQVSLESEKTALNTQKAALAAQQKMLQILDSQPQSSTDPVADAAAKLSQVGEAQLKTGQVEAATKTFAEVSKMQENQSLIADRKFKQTTQVAEYVGSLLDNVASTGYTKAAWDQANSIATVMTGQKSPFANMLPANATPEQVKAVVDKVRTGFTTQVQKAQIEREKALTAEAQVKTQNDIQERGLISARIDAERALADQRKKAVGEPKAVDTKDLVSLIQGDADNGKVPKPQAEALALGMQDEMEKYKRDGLSTAQAAQTAYQNAKKRGDLKNIGRAPAEAESGVGMIDDLLSTLDKADNEGISVAGGKGLVRRWAKENVGGTLGLTDETIANDFASKMTALQTELPSLLAKGKSAGYFSKLKAEKMATIARGLSVGDNTNTSRSSLLQLREMLAGGDSAAAPAKGGVVSLDDYLKSQGAQ
jgi:hypothetical protein